MSSNNLREAYLELKQYFGTISRDTFLGAFLDLSSNSIGGSNQSGIGNAEIIRKIQEAIFSDSTSQQEFSEIIKMIASYNSNAGDLNFFRDKLCFTDYDGTLAEIYSDKVPFNSTSDTDQGTGGSAASNKIAVPKGVQSYPAEDSKNYKLKSIFPKFDKLTSSESKIYAVQVWPADTPSHSVDAEIASAFLNSVPTAVMSQAVPYIDILVSTGVGTGPNGEIDTAAFSLGKFLGVNSRNDQDDVTFGAFSDPIGSSVVSKNVQKLKKSQQAVASMEIFTTPQTLVNATPENVRYNEALGGPIDIFRPYMSLDAFNVQVVSANAGFISKKTADMKITLFDKGRLSSIAPLVSPLAYNTVQFDITYGWSHPSGRTTAGRPGDAQYVDRIGQLIDAMKVTDTFTVVSNNITFNADGTVSIDLKLVSTAMNKFASRPVQLTNEPIMQDAKLAEILGSLRDKLSTDNFSSLNLPSYLNVGSSDNFLHLTPDQIKKLQTTVSSLQKKKQSIPGLDDVISLLIDLVGVPKKKGQKPIEGQFQIYQQSRIKEVSIFIDELIDTPDPFLVRGLQKYGVTEGVLKFHKYASLGKILIKVLGPQFHADNTEVVFVFGCLNENAAAVRDCNIAQFPIKLRGEGNEVYLQKVLEDYYKKNNSMSPQTLLQLIIENFIDFQGNRAYGLSEVFEPNTISAKTKTAAYVKELNKVADEEGGTLFIEQKKLENLKNIYRNLGVGDVSDPKFVIPKPVMNVDCRKNALGSKNIVRVNVFDAAADPSKSMGEMLHDVLRTGTVLTPPQTTTGSPSRRTPNHGAKFNSILQVLIKSQVLRPLRITDSDVDKIKGAAELKDELQRKYPNALEINGDKVQDIRFMRETFYKFLPTIIVGHGASGVTSANLTSQQNQSLATQAISRAVNQTPEGTDPATDYGMVLYPTQLTLEVFGSPIFKFFQRFFVDFGTNTSADNFYAITGISYSFTPGTFKCSLSMSLNDVFARTINIRRLAMESLASSVKLQKEAAVQQAKPKPRRKPKPKSPPK